MISAATADTVATELALSRGYADDWLFRHCPGDHRGLAGPVHREPSATASHRQFDQIKREDRDSWRKLTGLDPNDWTRQLI